MIDSKLIGIAALLAATATIQTTEAATNTGRIWTYGSYTAAFTPAWSATVLGGLRGEFAREGAPSKELYLLELFAGPNYTYKASDWLTLKGSVWYYYTGFPVRGTDNLYYQHSIEAIPSAEVRFGRWSFYDRLIFHNTVFASVYPKKPQRGGYGLVFRELFQVRYAATDSLGISIADEPFFSLKQSDEVDPKDPRNNGAGYWETGLRLNRLYAGIDYKVAPGLTVAPVYVFEQSVKSDGSIGEFGHYAFITISFVHRLFEPAKPPVLPPTAPEASPSDGAAAPVAPSEAQQAPGR